MTDTDRRRPGAARRRRTLLVTLLGVGIAYMPSWMNPLLGLLAVPRPSWGPAGALLWNWLATLALLGYVLRVECRPLSSLLVTKPTGRDLEITLYVFGAVMTYSWVINLLRPQPPNGGIEAITALGPALVLALVVTTAVTEEVLYRGYPIERVAELTGRRWLAAIISAALFVAPHVSFFGPDWLLYQGPGTLALYVLYLTRRNLVTCMILHLLTNAPILLPTILK